MAAPADINQYKELARRYGIAATPESVSRLTQLVARQDCCTDEICRVIEKDPGLSARLLRVANPHAADEAEYTVGTVDQALMRNGIGCALLLAMGTAKAIAAGILGLEPAELTDNDEIRDAAGELLNIMTGNFKSNLCDAGLDCRLQPPKVGMTEDFSTPVEPGGGLERLAFRAGKIEIFIEVTANPFMD